MTNKAISSSLNEELCKCGLPGSSQIQTNKENSSITRSEIRIFGETGGRLIISNRSIDVNLDPKSIVYSIGMTFVIFSMTFVDSQSISTRLFYIKSQVM